MVLRGRMVNNNDYMFDYNEGVVIIVLILSGDDGHDCGFIRK
jgi:hypothetical protein